MMIRARFLSAAVVVFALAACAAPPPPTSGTSDDEVALMGLGTRYAEAWSRGDVDALAALLNADYEVVSPDGSVIKGRDAFEAVEKKKAAERAGLSLKLNVQTTYVRWAGSANGASIGGTWTIEGLPPGMGSGKGAWTGLAVKSVDGQWRLSTGLIADYVPPPTLPAPPVKK